jgi:adenylate cyclase
VVVAGLLLIAGTIVAVRYLPFLLPNTQHLTPSTQTEPALPLPAKPSIAVLPFVNLSEDPKQEYFSDGLTEDLITDLSKFSGLFVIARNSVFTYKGKAVKVAEVGRELGVRYVLEGSVRKAEDRVRINTQLVEASTGHHLWSERYDRELKDIFALQDEIIQQIVANLNVELWQAELERVRRTPTNNLTAYDYLLRGAELSQRMTKETTGQARQMFEKAIELDPTYALAYTALGGTYHVEWVWQWSQDPQTLERWFALAQQALALDDSLPRAHMLLGQAYLWKRQHEQAIAESERAIALNPNDAFGYFSLAETLNLAGKPEQALGAAEQAMRLDPRNRDVHLFEVGWAYRLMDRYEEAITALKRVLTRSPNHVGAHISLAISYSELGREEEARAEVAEILRLSPGFSLEALRQRAPYKNQARFERTIAALRQAGLK